MLRFLRKHNKWILVVFGSLLMVVFLLPQAIQNFAGDPLKRTVGRYGDGTKVRLREVQYAARETEALRTISPALVISSLRLEDSATHWILLSRMASELGVIGEDIDGVDWIPQLARELVVLQYQAQHREMFRFYLQQPQFEQDVQSVTTRLAQNIEAAGVRGRLTEDDVRRALSKARGILRMYNAYFSVGRMSEERTRIEAAERLVQATADVIFLPALPELFAQDLTPTEEQLQEHYEKYRERAEGEGDFGLGYRQPQRVKLAWMKLDRVTMRAGIEPDPIEVRRIYESDRLTYTDEFSVERSRIESRLKDQKLDEVFREAQRVLQAEVLKAKRDVPATGAFLELPDDWTAPSFETIGQVIVEQVKERNGVDIPLPEVHVRDASWLTAPDLRTLPGIGASHLLVRGQQVRFEFLPFLVRELGGGEPFNLQAGVPADSLPLNDWQQNRYYFTVLDAREESPPETLDEVRNRVEEDYRKVVAYETLAADLSQWQQIALNDGLEVVMEAFNSRLPEPVAPDGGTAPDRHPDSTEVHEAISVGRNFVGARDSRLNTEEFRTAIMDQAAEIDPLKPLEDIGVQEATVGAALPSSFGIALARITRYRPPTVESYRQQAINAMRQAMGQESIDLELDEGVPLTPFGLAELRERFGYTDVGADEFEDELESEDEADSEGANAS